MKKWKIAGICLAVAVAAAASGCGKKTGTETTAAESTAAETEEIYNVLLFKTTGINKP